MHEEYLRMAVSASLRSPDDSTKNGAILVSRSGKIVQACNESPPRVPLDPARKVRPEKYHYIEHAERRVIYQAARDGVCTDGSSIYCLWYACPDCARAMVCAGVREVIGLLALEVLTPSRWREQVAIGRAILAEAGVRTRLYTEPLGMKAVFDNAELTI